MKPPPLPKTSLLGRLGLALVATVAVVAGFAVASLLFAVLVVTGLAFGGWLWWRLRRLARQAQRAAPPSLKENTRSCPTIPPWRLGARPVRSRPLPPLAEIAVCLDLAADRRPRDLCDEQVELLYAQAPLGVVASLLIAPLLVLTLWNALPRTILIGWLLALEATVLIRLALIAAFRRRAVPDTAAGRWITRYTWACAASGVCWGGCVVLLAFSPSLVHDAFIALILGAYSWVACSP